MNDFPSYPTVSELLKHLLALIFHYLCICVLFPQINVEAVIISLMHHFTVCRDPEALGSSTKTRTHGLTYTGQDDNSTEEVKQSVKKIRLYRVKSLIVTLRN